MYYVLLIILFVWHIFVVSKVVVPNVSDVYYKYYISGVYSKWNRGEANKYRYGDVIDFTKGGNSDKYNWGGISNQESWGSWTNKEHAYVRFHVDRKPKYDLILCINAIPYVNNRHSNQSIVIKINDVYIKRYDFNYKDPGNRILVMNIPSRIILSDNFDVELQIDIHNPISPKEVGLSEDSRKLGLGIASIVFQESVNLY
jgi:hypothetical protein